MNDRFSFSPQFRFCRLLSVWAIQIVLKNKSLKNNFWTHSSQDNYWYTHTNFFFFFLIWPNFMKKNRFKVHSSSSALSLFHKHFGAGSGLSECFFLGHVVPPKLKITISRTFAWFNFPGRCNNIQISMVKILNLWEVIDFSLSL